MGNDLYWVVSLLLEKGTHKETYRKTNKGV